MRIRETICILCFVIKTEQCSPSTPPSNRRRYCDEMVWNVILMTLQTNFRIESKNPLTLTIMSGVERIFDQNSSKSHFSKISAKSTISLMVGSSIWAGNNRHLHNVKSVCGKLVSAFNRIKFVISKFMRLGSNWYDFSTAKFTSKSYVLPLACSRTWLSNVGKCSGLYLKWLWNKIEMRTIGIESVNGYGWNCEVRISNADGVLCIENL